MALTAAHPSWEDLPLEISYARRIEVIRVLADLFRQIDLDKSYRTLKALTQLVKPRFG